MDTTESDNSALSWQAYRYLSGEMAAAEREAFELRLADDLELQKTLVSVVQLQAVLVADDAETVRTVVPSKAEPAPGHADASGLQSRLSFRWIAVASVAVSLAFLMMLSLPTPESVVSRYDGRELGDDHNAAVAAMWVSLAEDSDGDVRQDAAEGADTLEREWREIAVDALVVPDWMVSAVRHAGETDEMLPMHPAEEAL